MLRSIKVANSVPVTSNDTGRADGDNGSGGENIFDLKYIR